MYPVVLDTWNCIIATSNLALFRWFLWNNELFRSNLCVCKLRYLKMSQRQTCHQIRKTLNRWLQLKHILELKHSQCNVRSIYLAGLFNQCIRKVSRNDSLRSCSVLILSSTCSFKNSLLIEETRGCHGFA